MEPAFVFRCKAILDENDRRIQSRAERLTSALRTASGLLADRPATAVDGAGTSEKQRTQLSFSALANVVFELRPG